MISPIQLQFSGSCNGACAKPNFDPKTCKTDGCPMSPVSEDIVEITTKKEACAVNLEPNKPKGFFGKIIEGIVGFFKGFFADMKHIFSGNPEPN